MPLHDPIRLAEQIAVLDLATGGRISVVAGLGYRPEEYEQAGKSWKDRGKLLDESLTAMLAAWTGEHFEYDGRKARVTPVPMSPAQALHLRRRLGQAGCPPGGPVQPAVPACREPARARGLLQRASARSKGVTPFIMMPPPETFHIHVAEDPDQAWAELGEYFLHEATTYASWQTPDIHSAVHSHAKTVDELRAEGIYRVLTPEEIIDAAEAQGRLRHEPAAPARRRHADRGGVEVAEPLRRQGAVRRSPRPGALGDYGLGSRSSAS